MQTNAAAGQRKEYGDCYENFKSGYVIGISDTVRYSGSCHCYAFYGRRFRVTGTYRTRQPRRQWYRRRRKL